MTVIAHRTPSGRPGGGNQETDPGWRAAVFKAILTVVLVAAIVAAALGAATYLASKAFISMLD